MGDRRGGPRYISLVMMMFSLCLMLALPAGAVGVERAHAAAQSAPTASQPPPEGALPPDVVYVGQTGHYVRGLFLDHWRGRGGVVLFGYPLSEEYEEVGVDGVRRRVQLFDKARFELHDDGTGARVELGLLGREVLGARTFPPVEPFAPAPGREYIAATGHSLGSAFRDFWYANDGVRLLGYPLSEELIEDARAVQYFERGRLEDDAAAPAGRAVTMTALGATLAASRGWPLPTRITLTFSQPAPGQGTTVVAELSADRAVAVTGARFDDRPVTFFGDGVAYRALVGISPSDAAGRHRLAVEVREEGGARAVVEEVIVRETPFPLDRVYLPPGQEGLLDPDVLERELRLVRPLYAIFTPRRSWAGPFVMPAQGPITGEFGEARAYNDGPVVSWHNGLDIGAPFGAPVVAPAPGRVVYTGSLDIRGNFVAIDHGLGVLTCYFHQSEILVTAGQMVNTGDPIGRVGSTGLSTGPHLHWEVRIAGQPVSPWQWLEGDVLR